MISTVEKQFKNDLYKTHITMSKEDLQEQLVNWVRHKEQNGIKQQDPLWDKDKLNTIGGSSVATILGYNPYSTITKLVGEKTGLSSFKSDIKPQWGNLFEEVIKVFVETDRGTVILGEDLYVRGKLSGTSYSPDGLCVLDVVEKQIVEVDTIENGVSTTQLTCIESTKPQIVLVEFKCPYSRIPSGTPPKYYVPQVKMGLDLLELPTVGLFIEAVFRRCTWDDLGLNEAFDTTLVPKKSGDLPIALGAIGFYIDGVGFAEYIQNLRANPHKHDPDDLLTQKEKIISDYIAYYGSDAINDLGDSPPELFMSIMDAFDKHIICPFYMSVIVNKTESEVFTILNSDLEKFTTLCSQPNIMGLGILPWKLFRVDYHYIQKEPGFLNNVHPRIIEVLNTVKEINALPHDQKIQKYKEFEAAEEQKSTKKTRKPKITGFSDD